MHWILVDRCERVNPRHVLGAKRQNNRCLYFSSNAVPLNQDWISVETELDYIRLFFQLGIRMMHITYNRRNTLGDGCGEAANAGLSDFGRAAVAEMNRVGLVQRGYSDADIQKILGGNMLRVARAALGAKG